MEASLPSSSRRGKGSLGPASHLLDWEWGCFRGLAHWNSASALVSTCSAQVWPSPAPPVSIGAGVSGGRDQRQEPPASAAPKWESLWRSSGHPHTRPTGAYPWAFGPPVRLLSRLTWLQLRPPGQWCPNQVGALLDLASLDKQPVEVAPSFYPEGELWEAVKVEASSLLELLGDICHVVQRVLLLNSDHLSLPGSEVVEEAFPRLNPLCFPVWSLNGVLVVDLEHMLKVSSPSTGSILSSHLGWSGMGMMAGLEMRVSQGRSRGSSGCYPSSPFRVTVRSASEAPSPSLLPSLVRVGRVSGRSGSV